MNKKTKIAIAHSDDDLGKPGEYSRAQSLAATRFEERLPKVDGDVIIVGDCAKGMQEKFPMRSIGAVAWSTRIAP